MAKDIHPKYYPKAKVICACGAEFTVGSTEKKMEVEICSNCHPLYTGKQKFIDTAGRLERYQKIVEKSKIIRQAKTKPKNIKRKHKT
ncbi:50S ribosomal protein L31 [Patescibacteria group bacterium]|nr:50S ribosomal protein L31 [Patescibacteria group bacterium]